MRLLFAHHQSLYAKVILPLAWYFAGQGHEVAYHINRPQFLGWSWGFSQGSIRRHPTTVGIVNPQALRYVARLIDYERQWEELRGRLRYHRGKRYGGYDAVVATTKDLPWLREVAAEWKVPAFAVGYQHLPFVARVDGGFALPDEAPEVTSLFLSEHPFAQAHGVSEIFQGYALRACSFLYLDRVHARVAGGGQAGEEAQSGGVPAAEPASPPRPLAFLFHPGGYRGVVTQFGEGKAACYAKQKVFLERLCLPLIEAGFRVVIKIHPLRARHHDLADVQAIFADIARERRLPSGCVEWLGPEAWYWESAFRSRVILTFGSSSIYELWSAGLRNVYVCNFEGKARSEKFSFFESIFLDSYAAYLKRIEAWAGAEATACRETDPVTDEVFRAYSCLFTGRAVETAYRLITHEISA
ncbi:MAG: hypothetical protein HYY96_06740 [Candidatus Tectomicrobia bacterium]|nr:hypothetical protein [Candidatus Tectomicrobia bacterium]